MARCRRTALAALLLALAAAPPAAAKVAFVSERDGEPDIFVMADDGGAQINVSTDSAAPDVAPSWSPDGGQIVYQRGYGPDADLWVMAADGSTAHAIVDVPGADTAPSWSPDGKHIAFVSDRSGDDHLYVTGTDGQGTQRLDTGTTDPSDPAWSPDGRSIAYADSDGQLIHVIGADGTGDHVVGGPGPDALGGDQTPAWTPDGARLLFASLREASRSYDVWTMGLDGGGQQALTSSADREIDPAPGGGRVFFAGDAPGDYDVYSMAPDGSGPVRLTTAQGDDSAPAWASGGGAGAAQPGAPTAGGPGAAAPPAGKKKTPLSVRVSIATTRILVYPDHIEVRVPYRVNRAATVTVHLYRGGKLRAWFKHHGKPGPNVARWQQKIADRDRWRGRYTVTAKGAERTAAG